MSQESGITEGRATLKRGKLLKIKAQFEGKKIKSIRITGDFFIYPESTIEILEEKLKDRSIDEVEKIVKNVLKDCEYIGISPEDIVRAVEMAWMRRN